MGDRLYAGLRSAFGSHPNVGDIRGGKGLLAAVEFVEDKATKANFASDKKIANRLMAEMAKRGVMTRVRAAGGPHPNVGDTLFFSPPLIVTDAEVDRLVSVARESAQAVFGA
jgi:L-2,4-diaminobutyrate transaminase